MTFPRNTLAAVVVAGAAVAGGFGAATLVSESESVATAQMGCEGWPVQLTQGECFAAGTIRNVALYNVQGAAQFCKWEAANPGEWNRLKGFAATEVSPQQIVTWFGASLRNQLEAYFATGAPVFIIAPNEATNRCRTPLPPPVVQSVTPGQTDATVTVGS